MLELDTAIWGSKFWYILHYLANNFETNYSYEFLKFFNSLIYILPCPVCRNHYKKMIINDFKNIHISNKEIIDLVFNLHHTVNKRLDNIIYNKNVLINYNSKKKFYKNVLFISNILVNHDEKSFKQLKYFFILICKLDNKLTFLLDSIPKKFKKNKITFDWILEFKKNIVK